MLVSSGESELKLSPQYFVGDNASVVNNSQSNPKQNFQSQSPTLPLHNDEKKVYSPTSKDEGEETLTLLPQDRNGNDKVTLPSNDEDREGLQIQILDEMKREQDKSDRKVNFSDDIQDEHISNLTIRSKSCIQTASAGKSKVAQELSLDDRENSRKNASSLREHRKTEPNLKKKKRSKKHENAAMFFPPSQWSSRYGIQFFTVVIPKVTIVQDYEKRPKGSYALYHIEIKRGRQVIVRKYRYSQFVDFHKALLGSAISIILQQGNIYLPAKTWFKNVAPSFLEKRRLELEKYLHRLLQFKYSPREAIVQEFLALNEFEVKDFWIDH